MRKYNEYLKSMVDSWRSDLKRIHDLSTSNYSDEELYYSIMYWYGVEDDETGEDYQEQGVVNDITRGIKRGYEG